MKKKLLYTIVLFFLLIVQKIVLSDNSEYRGEILLGNKNNLKASLLNYEFLTGNPIDKKIIQKNFIQLKGCILSHNILCVENYLILAPSVGNGTKVNYKSGAKSITSLKEFRKNYDLIITSNVVAAFKNQTEDNLTSSYEGIMIGNGQMWLNYFCEAEQQNRCYFKIYVINADAKFFDK